MLTPIGADTDDLIRRRWLDNDFYGFIAGLEFIDPADKYRLKFGGAFHKYKGGHFGEIIWTGADVDPADIPFYYDNDAIKTEGSFFGKLDYSVGEKARVYADLQWRNVEYEFLGFGENAEEAVQKVDHGFFNPKLGITYALDRKHQLYLSFGIANREPNRDDYVDSSPTSRPEAERLFNTELGLRRNTKALSLGVNFYHMLYTDQLTLTGQINDVGAYSRINVDNSYRAGVELNAASQFNKKLTGRISATLSQNKIKAFDEFIDNWDFQAGDDPTDFQIRKPHENTDISFSPNVLASAGVQYQLLNKENEALSFDLSGKYVGAQFLDNTSNVSTRLDAYFYSDARLSLELGKSAERKITVSLLVRNLFDSDYSSNGWTYRFKSEGFDPTPVDPYAGSEGNGIYHLTGLFPQAGINFLASVSLEL